MNLRINQVIFVCLFTCAWSSAQSQFLDKPNRHLIMLESRLFDRAPLNIQYLYKSKRTLYSLRGLYSTTSFPKPEIRSFTLPVNYKLSLANNTFYLNPGIGYAINNHPNFISGLHLRIPVTYTTFKVTYSAPDAIFGTYIKESNAQHMMVGIELEHQSQWSWGNKVFLTAGLQLGYLLTKPYNFSPMIKGMENAYINQPGFGYGVPWYVNATLGIGIIIN